MYDPLLFPLFYIPTENALEIATFDKLVQANFVLNKNEQKCMPREPYL